MNQTPKLTNSDYSALTEEIMTNIKLLILKLVIESVLLSIRIFYKYKYKVTPIIGQKKYLKLILC